MIGVGSSLLSCNSHWYNNFLCMVIWWNIVILKWWSYWWWDNYDDWWMSWGCVGWFLDNDMKIVWLGECIDDEIWRMIIVDEPWWWYDGSLLVELLWRLNLCASIRSFNGEFHHGEAAEGKGEEERGDTIH